MRLPSQRGPSRDERSWTAVALGRLLTLDQVIAGDFSEPERKHVKDKVVRMARGA